MSKAEALSQNPTTSAVLSAHDEGGDDARLDAVISVAALVARADGWVQDVERQQLLDFLAHYDCLAPFDRADVLARFERRVGELRRPNGAYDAFKRLSRCADRRTAHLMLSIGDEIAVADSRLDLREEQLLRLLRARLRAAVE